MPTLHLLGTGAALAPPDRTTTMLAFVAKSVIVVDCGGDVVQRMLAAGIDLDRIRLLILTHEHPDHLAGFPLFMEKIWLAKRRRPIPVAGPPQALRQARKIFEAFDTSGWKGLPEVEWRPVALEEGVTVWEDEEWLVTAAPGKHSVPVIAVRVQHVPSGGAVVYSSDTERADAILRLAHAAEILVHESTGNFSGHTAASGAAELAREAGARRLVLVHIPPNLDPEELRRARQIFPEVRLGEDGASYPFDGAPPEA
jgi:ribonuclease Z